MKKFVVELGHSDLPPGYESNFAEMPISLLLKIAKNIKLTTFRELPNMCQTDVFTLLLI